MASTRLDFDAEVEPGSALPFPCLDLELLQTADTVLANSPHPIAATIRKTTFTATVDEVHAPDGDASAGMPLAAAHDHVSAVAPFQICDIRKAQKPIQPLTKSHVRTLKPSLHVAQLTFRSIGMPSNIAASGSLAASTALPAYSSALQANAAAPFQGF